MKRTEPLLEDDFTIYRDGWKARKAGKPERVPKRCRRRDLFLEGYRDADAMQPRYHPVSRFPEVAKGEYWNEARDGILRAAGAGEVVRRPFGLGLYARIKEQQKYRGFWFNDHPGKVFEVIGALRGPDFVPEWEVDARPAGLDCRAFVPSDDVELTDGPVSGPSGPGAKDAPQTQVQQIA